MVNPSAPLGFDPQAAALEPHPAEPVLPEQALSFSHLDAVFARRRAHWQAHQAALGRPTRDLPHWAPEMLQDRRRPRVPVTRETATRASVLIALAHQHAHDERMQLVLTQRTADLSIHAGQVSFPGGRAEAHDASPQATALREAQEEIGLAPGQVEIWGEMPEYLTATGFLVTPVIGRITSAPRFSRDAREVAEIFQVPLAFVMDPANHQRRVIPADQSPTGETIRFFAIPYGKFFIWGATAAMLRNLYRLLAAAWTEQQCR